jgi:ubiquinone/menaquinone biosynthesis C-methylase UbiE
MSDRSWVLDPEEAHIAALRRLADFGDKRVLEMGCGDGRLTALIARDAHHVHAFDPDDDAVQRARRALSPELADRVTFEVASATEIDVPRHGFDLVVFSWAL